MKKNPLMYVQHILVALEKVITYTGNVSKDSFFSNSLLQDGVIRQLEIVGEATKRVPSTLREKYPDINWKEMAGMRDKLIHDYMDVNLPLVWETATLHAPELLKKLDKMYEAEKLEQSQENLGLK